MRGIADSEVITLGFKIISQVAREAIIEGGWRKGGGRKNG